jgi:uncharacterized protein DUF6680
MTLFEGLIVLATLAGPIVAVRITRYLDDQKEIRERKLWVFKTLMATRAYTLALAHVEALNRIDLEFSIDKPKEKKIIETWRQYLDLLGDKSLSVEQWGLRRVDLLVELLYAMGGALGYEFDKTQIKNGTYSPVAHGRIEEEQEAIRRHTLELLQGKRVLPMFVTNLPNPQGSQGSPPREA